MPNYNFCVVTFPDSDFGAAVRRAAEFFAQRKELTPTIETLAAVVYAEHIKLAVELSHRQLPAHDYCLEYIAGSLTVGFSELRPHASTADVQFIIDLHTRYVY